MNRLERLTSVITFLQGKRYRSLKELAKKYEVSERTIFRDLKSLQESGVPIGFEQGRGYFIVDGFYLPPVMFTEEEALALLSAGKILASFGDNSLAKEFSAAHDKVFSALKEHLKERVERLENHLEALVMRNRHDTYSNNFLITVEKAIIERKCLNINYHSISANEKTVRMVEPWGIYYFMECWYLIAFCKMRKDTREFRLDRIMDLTTSSDAFTTPSDFSISDFLKKRMENYPRTEVAVRMSDEDYRRIERSKYSNGFVEAEMSNGKVTAKFNITELEFFCRYLLLFCPSTKVLSPPSVIESINKIKSKIAELQ